MPAPYSEDLRFRIVFQATILLQDYPTIARNNHVSLKTVGRFVRKYWEAQSLRAGTSTGRSRIISKDQEDKLFFELLRNPTATALTLANKVFPGPNKPSLPTLGRALRRIGFTRKRSYKIASQRDEIARGLFLISLAPFELKHFVFFDEMGAVGHFFHCPFLPFKFLF